MGELGQLLRATREEKGFTLDEVERHTRIRAKFVRALEEESYQDLPTPGHVSGFLRSYALYLGLDVDEVRAIYNKETSNRKLFEPGIFHPKDIDLAPRRPLLKASLVLGLVIAVVVLVIGGWAFWRYGWPNVQPLLRLLTPQALESPTSTVGAQALVPTATQTRARPTNTPVLSPTATPLPPTATSTPAEAAPTATEPAPTSTATREQPVGTRTATPPSTATPTPTSVRPEGVVLEIAVIERSWLQVTVDEQERPGELLEAGQERTWEGRYAIHLVCGNAGGIEATVNGESLGVLGARAQVVEKTWTPEGEATPTPAAARTPTPTPTPAS
jgi:cytoskeletal protein RodZ